MLANSRVVEAKWEVIQGTDLVEVALICRKELQNRFYDAIAPERKALLASSQV